MVVAMANNGYVLPSLYNPVSRGGTEDRFAGKSDFVPQRNFSHFTKLSLSAASLCLGVQKPRSLVHQFLLKSANSWGRNGIGMLTFAPRRFVQNASLCPSTSSDDLDTE